MFHLAAFTESQDTGGVLTYCAALFDGILTVAGDDISVPEGLPNLGAVLALGATITQARLEAPSLRRTILLDVRPLNVGAEPLSPYPIINLFDNPLPLDPFESIRALVAEGAAGAERETVLVWLTDSPATPVRGEIFTLYGTAAVTLTANAWTSAAITWSQTLPAGTYQVVGMRAESAGLVAARLSFVGQSFRPGCVGLDAAADIEHSIFRYGNLGVWGEFAHNQPPNVDFLSVSADTNEYVWLDLVRVS